MGTACSAAPGSNKKRIIECSEKRTVPARWMDSTAMEYRNAMQFIQTWPYLPGTGRDMT